MASSCEHATERRLVEEYMNVKQQAFENPDAHLGAHLAWFADDCTFLPDGHAACFGRQAIRDYYEKFWTLSAEQKQGRPSLNFKIGSLDVKDDAVVVQITVEMETDGQSVAVGKSLTVFRKADFKVRYHIFNKN